MRPMVKYAAVKKWGDEVVVVEKMIDCELSDQNECVLIGMLYKDMSLRGSVSFVRKLSHLQN